MNRSSIEKALNAKHKSFVASIEDEKIKKLVSENSIITGGCIVSMLQGEEVNDYDYYFRNIETVEAVAAFFVKKYNDSHKKNFEVLSNGVRVRISVKSGLSEPTESAKGKKKYQPRFVSDNAITLSDQVQLIIRFYGEPDEIHKNYDFVHCCNYWTSWDNKLVLNPRALESIITKQLEYQGSLYPICSVIRTRKFINKGWTIHAGEYLKMCLQVSDLDLNNFEVLQEQLAGVDVAYFADVLNYCKKQKEDDPNFVLSTPVLIEAIERMM